MVSPLFEIPRSSGILPMSTTADGVASRSFINGIRLWPPASSFAPGLRGQQALRIGERFRAMVVKVRGIHG